MQTESPKKSTFREILTIFGLFLIWRAITWIFAFIAEGRLDLKPDPGYGKISPWHFPAHKLLGIWARWDSGYYLEIARDGYFFDITKGLYNTVFFPLYPLLIRGGSFLTAHNYLIAGIILSSIFTFLACLFLYKLAKIDLPDNIALRTVFYFLIFPTAIFLIAIYPESLFIFLACASSYYARKNKWFYASLFGSLVTLVKPQGIILFPILLLEYIEQRKFSIKKIRLSILNTVLIPLGLGTYMYYLKIKFGNPFLFFSQQNFWGRTTDMSFGHIWKTLFGYFKDFLSPGTADIAYYINKDFDLIFFLIFLILSLIIFFYFRMSYGLYILLSILIPLSTGTLISIGRFGLLLFPIFIFLAKISAKRPLFNYGIIILFTTLFSLYTILFVNWYWAG